MTSRQRRSQRPGEDRDATVSLRRPPGRPPREFDFSEIEVTVTPIHPESPKMKALLEILFPRPKEVSEVLDTLPEAERRIFV